MPYICVNPLVTRRALYLSMLPSTFLLSLKTHLHLTTFFPCGCGTVVQVPACSSKPISRSIASFHLGQLERDCASCTILGSPSASWIVAAITSLDPTRLAHSQWSALLSLYSIRSA